jgi:ABC-type Fe3+/spermidine/putrescine transport system ATPase subunit
MADRIVVMNEGRVEQIGTAEEIYTRPRTRFVAGFIGLCNFLPGEVTAAVPGQFRVRSRGLEVAVATDGACPAVGTSGSLSVRPEVIRLLRPEDAPSPGENVAEAKVREVTYLGAFRHYRLELASGHELLTYEQTGTVPVQEGSPIRVAWEPRTGSFQPEEPTP